MKNELTQERLKELLHYDPETGLFTNLTQRSSTAKKGTVSGSMQVQGYITIKINKKAYQAHRLVWLYTYGDWPIDQIDHINKVKNDNRLINLRQVNNSENQQNVDLRRDNTSGHKGVSWNKKLGKWHLQLQVNKKKIYLGLYDNIDEAVKVYKESEITYHTHRSMEIK